MAGGAALIAGAKLAIQEIIEIIIGYIVRYGVNLAISSITQNHILDETQAKVKESLGQGNINFISNFTNEAKNKLRLKIRELVRMKLKEKKQQSWDNEFYKKITQFNQLLNNPPDQPESDPEVPNYCKKSQQVEESDSNPLSVNDLSYVVMAMFNDELEDEYDEQDNKTGKQTFNGGKCLKSVSIPANEWEQLIKNPFVSNEVLAIAQRVADMDPSYASTSVSPDLSDNNSISLVTGKVVGTYISYAIVRKLYEEKVVNLVGTSRDKRVASWIKFWNEKKHSCSPNISCKIQSEEPEKVGIHNRPVLRIVGGHIRILHDSNKSFLILPICSGHNRINNWDEGQAGDPYMTTIKKCSAVEINAVKLPPRQNALLTLLSLSLNEQEGNNQDIIDKFITDEVIDSNFDSNFYNTLESKVLSLVQEKIGRILESVLSYVNDWIDKEYGFKIVDILVPFAIYHSVDMILNGKDGAVERFKDETWERFKNSSIPTETSNYVNELFNQNEPSNKITDCVNKLENYLFEKIK